MPLTPLHYSIAYVIYKINSKLNIPGLVVGSMLPDLEIIVILLFGFNVPSRLVLHSLLGAITVGTALSVTFTFLIYAPTISGLFKVNRNRVDDRCRLSPSLILSCLLGGVSHTLLDVANHLYNPIFWPFQIFTFSPISQAIGDMVNSFLLILITLIVLSEYLPINKRRNLWENLLVGRIT